MASTVKNGKDRLQKRNRHLSHLQCARVAFAVHEYGKVNKEIICQKTNHTAGGETTALSKSLDYGNQVAQVITIICISLEITTV